MSGAAEGNTSSEVGPDAAIAVIRRRSEFVFGWIACGGLFCMMIWLILVNPSDIDVWVLTQGLLAIFPAMWGAWLVTAHPKLALWSWGMDVTNWFYRYRIPWRAIRSVEASDEIVVHLVDGGRIKLTVAAFSVVTAKHGSRLQRAIWDRVEEARKVAATDPDADTAVARRLDVRPVPFLVLLAGLMLLAWFANGAVG